MSSLNRNPAKLQSFEFPYGTQNHHGLPVKSVTPEQQLRRLTMAHMLWEKQFYIDGKDAAQQIVDVVAKCPVNTVVDIAKEARTAFKLRHVPLVLARALATKGHLKAAALADIIQRPDEMSEFLSLYWKDKKQPVSNQVKKGLALAFSKFNEYQLAKWDKNSAAVSLRDVMFLTHPKPANAEQEALFKKVANKQLATPDTWETELSAGADKKETFTRLMAEKKLGALAFLRNLRGMLEAGVRESEIRAYASQISLDRVLPFRFIAAARMVPQLTDMLEAMMFKSLESHDKLKGRTRLLVDVSGSMFGAKISAKSDLDRYDAAVALAILCREICEDCEIFSFSNQTARIPKGIRGFALIEAIKNSQRIGGTYLRQAIASVNAYGTAFDRCIVFTDEQSSTMPGSIQSAKNYIINVAAYEQGLNHNEWLTVSGFSEAVLDYIQEYEKFQL